MPIDYVALFGDDFEDILTALSTQYSTDIEAMFLGILDRMVYDADIFALEIEKSVQMMLANGMSEAEIKKITKMDMFRGGRIFGHFKNEIKAAVVEASNQTSRMGQYEQYFSEYNEDSDFIWITVTGHKICPDCSGLGGDVDTFRNWEARGLPASGHTVCRGYCYCVLDPVGRMDPEVKTEAVQEKNAYSE